MKGIRSLLFVPAEEKRLSKIGYTDADAYIIDLEDSIGVEDKEAALQRTVEFLRCCGGRRNLFVRINKLSYRAELSRLQRFDIGIVLPKIESEADYGEAADILRTRSVIALIETPQSLLNVGAIASYPWVTALAFGAEDFSAATNMRNSIDTLLVPKTLLVLAAKANRKQVYDTPCFRIRDKEAMACELKQAVELGFDGKLAIHPEQAEAINEAFQLSDPQYVQHIIETYEASAAAVCEIDGRVYEKPHIDRLREMLACERQRKKFYTK